MTPLGKWAARGGTDNFYFRDCARLCSIHLAEVGYFPFAYLNSGFKNILLVCGAIEVVYYFHKDVMEWLFD